MKILDEQLVSITREMPWVNDFFLSNDIDVRTFLSGTVKDLIKDLGEDFFAEKGTSAEEFCDSLITFIEHSNSLFDEKDSSILSLTIEPGFCKDGSPEALCVNLDKGKITAIVGPTGSGKSRLLADIESLAQGDTPTGRKVLINGRAPTAEERFSSEGHLIAQLSQNMNFVMDLSVEEFLTLHAESRMVKDPAAAVREIYENANFLAGERFDKKTPVTQLSGGQSRSLMIADTALLSPAPVVLIDEIENAGVDKIRSLELLVSNQKIVLISTHDPLLALSADQRLVIRNGGISKLLVTSNDERGHLEKLSEIDRKLSELREVLRQGGALDVMRII